MQPLKLKRISRSAGTARGRARALLHGLALSSVLASSARAAAPELQFSSTVAFAGERSSVLLSSITDFSFQGFSVSAAYDPVLLSLVEVTTAGTITEAIAVDFFEANIFPERGGFVIGCLVDAVPPFEGREIPGLGVPLAVAKVTFDVPADAARQVTRMRFQDGFGDPPITTLLSVLNQGVRPELLTEGLISITRPLRFVRGDANQDSRVDIADPVFIISFLFQNQAAPPCRDAADGNDDETLDLADAIFILQYYFMRGLHPPPPFPNPGTDPTPGRRDLGCNETIF